MGGKIRECSRIHVHGRQLLSAAIVLETHGSLVFWDFCISRRFCNIDNFECTSHGDQNKNALVQNELQFFYNLRTLLYLVNCIGIRYRTVMNICKLGKSVALEYQHNL